MSSRGGLKAVEGALDRARPAPRVARGSREEEEQGRLPLERPGCPVIPLGKMGQTCFYLDEAGQMIALGPRDHGKTHIQSLFGRKAHLVHEYWPRFGKPDPRTGEQAITGWRPEEAAEELQASCAHAGLFDPQGKERGVGAWRGEGGELIFHFGDKVWRSGLQGGLGWSDPGVIDGIVYPTAAPIARPDPGPVGDDVGPQLLGLLRCWSWERPRIDPYLLMGFAAQASFGGALDWRSHVWVTGDSATGKSTLETKFLKPLFHGGHQLRTHQATEAAIRQTLGKKTLPVFFDELEAEEGDEKAKKVIGLARLASSEGVIFRGGSDHKAAEFIARSCFYFSSILMPAMLQQDRNRLAILELREIPRGAKPPMIEPERMVELGKQMRRRVMEQWWRLEATLSAYKAALGRVGHRGRSADQFGGLLAFADLLMFDHEPDAEQLDAWTEVLKADTFAETADNQTDAEEACEHLVRHQLRLRGGDEPEPIGRWVARAIRLMDAMDPDGQADIARARRVLENHGLRVVGCADPEHAKGITDPVKDQPAYLAIAARHEALETVFRDKRWAKGVWNQTFGRVRGAVRRCQVRMAGTSGKATLIPVDALIDGEDAR